MPEATKTRAELVTEAADCLMIVSAGNSLEAEDRAVIDGQVDPLLGQLLADGICEIADDGAIPVQYFKALGELLANASATKFGLQYSADKKAFFESQLLRSTATRPTYQTLKAEYF